MAKNKKKKRLFYRFIKRAFDIFASLLAIIVFSPFLLIVAILIKCSSKGPIFFRQERIGRNNKPFKIIKFRTMYVNAPKNVATNQLDNPEVYITKVGRVLRKLSIDELPQLFNILFGQMSVVGPRPPVPSQHYIIEQRTLNHASELRPGLSGWAQIKGRDDILDEDKVRYDGEYVKIMSVWVDIKIIFLTILKVFKAEGVKEGGIKEDNSLKEENAESQEENKVKM